MPEPSAPRPSPGRPPSLRDEFAAGAVAIAPVVVACLPIGLLFGALAAQKGLSTLETTLMSAAVFAGGAQFVAIEIWQSPTPWLVLTISALLVNIRHVLMGASLAPKMGRFSTLQRLLAFALLADEIWALAERRAQTAPLTPAWFAGLALPLYLAWISLSAAGTIVGAALGDPARLGFDFAFPAIFIALIMSFWKGPRTGAVLVASGLAAVAVHQFVGGAWYIAAGALAGVATAAITADVNAPATEGNTA